MEGVVGTSGKISNTQNRLWKSTKTGKGFHKMDKKNITTIKEDLVNDFYALAQVHSEEIWKLVQEFDDDKLQFTMELETYERERMQPTKEQL